MDSAILHLREFGFEIDDSVRERVWFSDPNSEEKTLYDVLMAMGIGKTTYDDGEWGWIPSSSQVYAFDAEVFDITLMYTFFLQVVQAIVPDVVISDVSEDLSGITEDWVMPDDDFSTWTDGRRSVSFNCNGHPYTIELESWLDWINPGILDYMNQVLEAENCSCRLHAISEGEMVIIIYDIEERADELRQMIPQGY
ncbi:MAG: hypothetical protein IKP40_14300 [Clostridia bacterium]|nr:hypothetical protein [Clostridia bacterium]